MVGDGPRNHTMRTYKIFMRDKCLGFMPATVVHTAYSSIMRLLKFLTFFPSNPHLITWEPEKADQKLSVISRFLQRIVPPPGIRLLSPSLPPDASCPPLKPRLTLPPQKPSLGPPSEVGGPLHLEPGVPPPRQGSTTSPSDLQPLGPSLPSGGSSCLLVRGWCLNNICREAGIVFLQPPGVVNK